jgi:hypothetical protein
MSGMGFAKGSKQTTAQKKAMTLKRWGPNAPSLQAKVKAKAKAPAKAKKPKAPASAPVNKELKKLITAQKKELKKFEKLAKGKTPRRVMCFV